MQILLKLLGRKSQGDAGVPARPERPRDTVQRAAREAIRQVDMTCEIIDRDSKGVLIHSGVSAAEGTNRC